MLTAPVGAAPDADLWDMWIIGDQRSTTVVDHSAWQQILNIYIRTDASDGINRFDYGAVTDADRDRLQRYIERLTEIDPRKLKRIEQRAYWINLYNALTVDQILERYPVGSIKFIKGGFLNPGPWNEELIVVAGQDLTLNDIEHRILRPIWNDPRIHYALNCASLSCPNLSPQAYTAANTEELLESGRTRIH